MRFEGDVRVKDVGTLILPVGGAAELGLGGVVVHHSFHVRVDLAIFGVPVVFDVMCSLIDVSYLMLDLRTSMNQQFIGSLKELRLATFLGEAHDLEEFLQLNDSEFCQISL